MEAQQTSKTQSAKQNLLTKKDVQRSFWRWTFFSHSNYNKLI